MATPKNDLKELVLVTIAALAPLWILAGKRDLDEVIKSGVGIACVGAVVTIYRIWRGRPGGHG